MKAVNLVPADARRGRASGAGSSPSVSIGTLSPAYFAVILLIIVVAIVLLRVIADNNVNNKKATLSAEQAQVATVQAEASKLSAYVGFVQGAQQRETQIKDLAEERFPWARTLDQISHVLPASTSLTSLSATTSGSTTASNGTTLTGPTFTLDGCADTSNQNGTATLLRRLTALSLVTNVGFQSSTRALNCGNQFALVVSFSSPGGSSTTSTAGSTSAVPATTTATSTTTTGTTTSGATG